MPGHLRKLKAIYLENRKYTTKEMDQNRSQCPGYDTKIFDGEALVLEFWGMWSTLSSSLLPGPF